MRTSTTATSGRWAPTLRSRSSASPAWPATSKPDSSSSRASPSRSNTESSARTTRSGSLMSERLMGSADPPGGLEELVGALARELGLRDEPAGARTGDEWTEIGGVAARHEHDVRAVAVGQPRRDVEAVDIGQLDVEEHVIGPQPLR